MIQSRKRVGLAAITAAASMATVFALPTTANAAAVAPDAVRNATATGGEGTLTVSWRTANTGEPATSYVVVVYTEAGVQVGNPHIVLAPTTTLTLDEVKAGNYTAEIYSHNAYPGFGGPVPTDVATVVAPVTTPPVTEANYLAYRPYKNWDDLIDQEYRFWTGCSANPAEVAGRLPRDDEFTFWRQQLTNPAWSTQDWDVYVEALSVRSAAEWGRLTNNASWLGDIVPDSATETNPGGVLVTADTITSAGYTDSIAYKAMHASYLAELTTIPTTGGFAPADDPVNGGNGNNLIDAAEKVWAETEAKNYASWSQHLVDNYGPAVNALAEDQANEDVYFARRVKFVRSLAEDAAQTGGPAFRLYSAYFSRIPDAKGLCFWSNALRTDWSLLNVSEFFVQSDEFVATYGEYDANADEDGVDAAEFVSLVYRNVLERDADGAGAAFWTRQLQTERASAAEMLIGFSESPEFTNRMSTKVGTGLAFLHLLGRMPTVDEYVWSDLVMPLSGPYHFNPAVDSWYTNIFYWNNNLYQAIVDGVDGWTAGEYTKRAAIEIPRHLHPHELPGTQPHPLDAD